MGASQHSYPASLAGRQNHPPVAEVLYRLFRPSSQRVSLSALSSETNQGHPLSKTQFVRHRVDPMVCLPAGGPPTCKDFTSWYAAQLTRKLQKADPYAFRWSWTGQSARV